MHEPSTPVMMPTGLLALGGFFSFTAVHDRRTSLRSKRAVEKISSATYSKLEQGAETGLPTGLGFDTIFGFSMLMQDNKNRAVFR